MCLYNQESDYHWRLHYRQRLVTRITIIMSIISLLIQSTIGESSMATYVQKTGPLSVCLDAETWNSYTGGIMTTCAAKPIDHCVQAVGVDTNTG